MAKNFKRFVLALCVLALCIGAMGMAALAVSYDPVTATIPVEVILSGTLPEEPDKFQVELTADEANNPMPEGSEDGVYVITLKGAASRNFKITFDQLGVYHYTAKQLDLGNPDCYQDAGVYNIIATVTNNEDYTAFDLTVAVYREGEAEKCEKLTFKNRYANPVEFQIEASKTLDKAAPKDGAFQFELLDAEGNVIETTTNEGQDVLFTPILCDAEGTVTFTIREVEGKDSTIIYDKSVYTAIVTGSKDENGNYQADVVYKLKDQEIEGIPTFANTTKPIIPQTGDNANLALWIGIMAAAVVVIVILLVLLKKPRKEAALEAVAAPEAQEEVNLDEIIENAEAEEVLDENT